MIFVISAGCCCYFTSCEIFSPVLDRVNSLESCDSQSPQLSWTIFNILNSAEVCISLD